MESIKQLVTNQIKQIDLETQKLAAVNKIREHLETTCLKKEDIEKIMGDFSTAVAGDVAAEIPGQLMRMEIQPSAMKFQRKNE